MLLQHLGLVTEGDKVFDNPLKTNKLLKQAKVYSGGASIDLEKLTSLGFSFVKAYPQGFDDVVLRTQIQDFAYVQILTLRNETSGLDYSVFCYDKVIENGKVKVHDPTQAKPYEISLTQV
jgi:hypothetical protein